MKYQSVNDEISFFDSIENNKKIYPILFVVVLFIKPKKKIIYSIRFKKVQNI